MNAKLIAMLLLATATFALGQKYGRGAESREMQWLVVRAQMVLADPGRWAPAHVARVQQILADSQARQQARLEAARREVEWRLAEQERIARESRLQDMERRLEEMERRLEEMEREQARRCERKWDDRRY